VAEKKEMMISSMISDVLIKCGLGSPATQFTTNDSEINNKRIKDHMQYKQVGEHRLIRAMYDLVLEQEQEFVRAFIGESEIYEFRKQFSHYCVKPDVWWAMNEYQRRNYIKTLLQTCVSDMFAGAVIDPMTARKPEVSRNNIHVSYKEFELQSLQGEGIWSKAGHILSSEELFEAPVCVGGHDKAYSVKSISALQKQPYYLKLFPSGKVECQCPHYKAQDICSHSVAAAAKSNRLLEYSSWYKKKRKKESFSSS